MVNYLIFGGGMMGEAIAFDLLQTTQGYVIIIETDPQRIEYLNQRFSNVDTRLRCENLTLGTDDEAIKQLLLPVSVAFGAIDYRFNVKLSKLCIESSTHFLDLGGNPDIVSQQYDLHDHAVEKDVTIIPDCGLAPGMVNVIAGGLISTFDSVEECHLRVGGLPQVPEGILKYQQVFSIRGLTNEYKEDSVVLRDGKIEIIPGMTELEDLYFPEPFGRMEAFQTAGGTSSLPRLYENRIKELTYKTIRYPGHMKFFRFLIDLDLLSDEAYKGVSPREMVEEKLVNYLPKNQPDVVLIRILIIGKRGGDYISETWQCIDYHDAESGISSMGRTTAYPISIIGQMIASGKISSRGVVPGETEVPLEKFVAELEKRKISFEKTTEYLS